MRHISIRHLDLPRVFSAYRPFGRLDHVALYDIPGREGVRAGRTDLYVSGPFLPQQARTHQWPLLVYYVSARGTLLGWLRYAYVPIDGVLYPSALESVSWFGSHRVSERLVREYEEGTVAPRREVHWRDEVLHRVRHYRFDEGSPPFVYEEYRGHRGVLERATDMRRVSPSAWIMRTVHYPRQAHEQQEAYQISLAGPEPFTVHGPGHILTNRHLDDVLTQPLFHRSLKSTR
ncbi:MAG: hypothetical protein AAB570_00785 [Patescibacteria group bacterium]